MVANQIRNPHGRETTLLPPQHVSRSSQAEIRFCQLETIICLFKNLQSFIVLRGRVAIGEYANVTLVSTASHPTP